MKLKYQSPKRKRIKRYFRGVAAEDFNLWFSEKDFKLKTLDEARKDGYSFTNFSFEKVATVRAFRRFIKKHKEIPLGTKLVLHSRYVGHNVIFTKNT